MYNNLYSKYLVPIILSNPNIQAMKRESLSTICSKKNSKIIVLCTFMIFSISLNAQNNAINNVTPIVTIADSVQQCLGSSGTVIIPITTEHSWNVAGISLALNINTAILSYVTVQNIHPELQSGVLLVNQVGTAVMVSWINPFAEANIGFGTMFELVFNAVPGQSQLSWDIVSQGFCEYTNLNQNILPAIFTDGNFTAWSLPTVDAGPDVTIFMNDCTILTGTGVGAGGAYLWNDGSTTVSIYVCPTVATTYTVTVTDANGCTDSDDVMVNVIPRIVTIANSVQQCLGTPGSVIVPITTEHSWNVAGISLALNINPAILSYTTVQNIHPELLSGSLLVNQVGALVMVSWINPFGEANIGFGTMFELVFNAVPGQSPLSWDVTTQGFCEYTNLNQNILSADFTDGNFTAWSLPTADAGPDVTVCEGDCTTLSASGGITYEWSTGEITASINVCSAVTTTYGVTVTDLNGCTDSDDVTVTVYPAPVADAGPDVSICEGDCIIHTASGGLMYLWSNSATDASINVCPTSTTIYTVTVTDANNCTNSDDVTVVIYPPAVADAGPDVTVCEGDCTTLTASGGLTYIWSTGEITASISVCPTTTTTYVVTVTDMNGCTDSDDVTVSVTLCTRVSAKTLLQCPYAGNGLMSTSLQSVLPNNQPYNRIPWNYNGSERLISTPVNMVDWILIELRDASDSSLIIAQRAALLMNDGNIADTNLATSITFDSIPSRSYYLCLHHRNSLPVMSANPIPIPNPILFDFSDPVNNPPFGGTSQALIELEPGIYGMIGGDVNSDGVLKYSGPGNDRALILQLIVNESGSSSITTTINGYYAEDANMDATVKYSGSGNDPLIIIQNLINLTGSASITTIFISPVPHGVKSNP